VRANGLQATGFVLFVLFHLTSTLPAQLGTDASADRVVITGSDTPAFDGSASISTVESRNTFVESVSVRTPNFLINDAGGSSFNDVYSIRGLSNTPNFSKQAVVVYIDDVPSSSTFTNFTDLVNPATIELLRGPQGDLFGKNAEAGLINIQTKVSDNSVRLFAAGGIGDYDLRSFSATASGPMIRDVLFFKVDVMAEHRDGYLHNVFRDTRPDYQNQVAGRFVARLAPSEDWEVSASVEMHNNRDGVQRYVPLAGDPFEVAFDFDGKTRIQGDIEALRISRIWGAVRVAAISSRRNWRLSPYEADFDYSSEPIVRGSFHLRQTQLAQEIRLEPIVAGGENDWRVGLFADRVSTSGHELYALPNFEKRITFDDGEYNAAIFGRLTHRFGAMELFAGMRLDYTANGIDRGRRESFSPATTFSSTLKEWNIQPKVGVRYHASETAEIYAQSTYGYKNGGFSFLESDPRLAGYDAEHVLSNEVGFHASSADKRATAKGAIFYNFVTDYQVERLSIPPDITVVNAPRVASCGVELEISAKPVDQFEVRAAFGYTHSEFTQFHDPLTNIDYAGNTVPFAPEFTVTINVRYQDRTGAFTEAELVAAGEIFYDEANTAFLRQAPRALINVKVGYQHKAFRAYVYCDNANDSRYFSQKIGYAGIGTPGAPRTVGVALALEL
jgi:iron complex outermembrane recepter protein